MKTALFMYQVSKKSLPSNLLANFHIKQKNEFYNLRSKSKEMFELKYVRTEQKQMSLSIHGVRSGIPLMKILKHVNLFIFLNQSTKLIYSVNIDNFTVEFILNSLQCPCSFFVIYVHFECMIS